MTNSNVTARENGIADRVCDAGAGRAVHFLERY